MLYVAKFKQSDGFLAHPVTVFASSQGEAERKIAHATELDIATKPEILAVEDEYFYGRATGSVEGVIEHTDIEWRN